MDRLNKNITDEKLWFTHKRKKNIRAYGENNHDQLKQIHKLEQEYGSFCLVPLDIPRISCEGFEQWYFENAKPSFKLKQDVASSSTGNAPFFSIDAVGAGHDKLTTLGNHWSRNFRDDFQHLWPDLWGQLEEYLPLTTVPGFTMWSSRVNIIPHRDDTIFIDLPVEFRIVLDNSKKDNLFVSEVLPNQTLEQKLQTGTIPLDIETNTFAWNNLRCQHHSVYNPDSPKIIFVITSTGAVDWKKYRTLIERSVDKYKNHCMISSRQISDYIYN